MALSNGVPMESVFNVLSHRNVHTTQIYAKGLVDKLSEDMNRLASRITGDFIAAIGNSSTPQSRMKFPAFYSNTSIQ